MASTVFRCKQFSVRQDRCAMKVGTDGLLLGAWAAIPPNTQAILDIGAGTGIIALQMAQRTTAETIDALEIDANAYEQCVDNFENSPWGDRLFCYHASLQEFSEECEIEGDTALYDFIVSNPPFFSEDFKTSDTARDTARFADALPFRQLVAGAATLLSAEGVFAVILPKKEEEHFIQLASEASLHPQRICRVRGTETSEIKRTMMEFSFRQKDVVMEHLTLEISRHQYTDEYKALVRDFYLKL